MTERRTKKFHRMDGYKHREKFQFQIDAETKIVIDELAETLRMSTSHFCDLIMGIAVEEGREYFVECVRHRLAAALAKKRKRDNLGY